MADELIKPDALHATPRPSNERRIERGQWYWLTHESYDGKTYRDLTCVTHVGSNYVGLRSASANSWRIHFDEFDDCTEFEPHADQHINTQIKKHWDEAQALMREVQALMAKLGVTPRGQLTDGVNGETQALAIRSGEPVEQYKKDLIKAKKTTLPKLFERIDEENKRAARWMKARLIPLKAEAEDMKKSIEHIEDRIFSVELYAGLVETIERIHSGKPTANDQPIHIMQRRHYMDEECLVGYEHGGMDYKNVKDFDRWLCKPKNRDRILPFPRTIVAFQVRHNRKHREADSLAGFISMWHEDRSDQMTFLYFRNGERVYRLQTGIEFDAKLFPDRDRRVMGEGKLWAEEFAGDIKRVITDEEHQGIMEDKDDHRHDRFRLYEKSDVYYDDIKTHIEKQAKEYNRLVLVVQGLLDRSPVFHPHPPWQLWTSAGFETGVRLVFDDSRALVAGEKPDFETYRAKLNARLTAGSLTVGQEEVWERREAKKYNRNERYEFHKERHRPDGDPGPGTLAHVARYSRKSGACTYTWERERRRPKRWGASSIRISAKLTTGDERVLNVDAYKPGDFHVFFDDPRTRQEYLQWAPLLLEAEECHAGNRKLKPDPSRGVQRAPVQREERPEDLRPTKPRPAKPPLGSEYRDVRVRLVGDHTTKGGDKFKDGEILIASGYHRRTVWLHDPKKKYRCIRGVSIRDVVILGKVK